MVVPYYEQRLARIDYCTWVCSWLVGGAHMHARTKNAELSSLQSGFQATRRRLFFPDPLGGAEGLHDGARSAYSILFYGVEYAASRGSRS